MGHVEASARQTLGQPSRHIHSTVTRLRYIIQICFQTTHLSNNSYISESSTSVWFCTSSRTASTLTRSANAATLNEHKVGKTQYYTA